MSDFETMGEILYIFEGILSELKQNIYTEKGFLSFLAQFLNVHNQFNSNTDRFLFYFQLPSFINHTNFPPIPFVKQRLTPHDAFPNYRYIGFSFSYKETIVVEIFVPENSGHEAIRVFYNPPTQLCQHCLGGRTRGNLKDCGILCGILTVGLK